jgi:hypothetical protein
VHPQKTEVQLWVDSSGKSALAISPQIKSISADTMVDEIATEQSISWDNYQETDRTTTTLNGYPALWVLRTWDEQGVAMRGFIVGLVRNRMGFVVQGWATEATYATEEAEELHALWVSPENHQSLGHEMTHIITAQGIGEPSEALLGEGIAVCLDHSGRKPHSQAAGLLAQGKLLPLAQLLGDTWFQQDAEVAYAECGSFACYLMEKCGVERFQALYLSSDLQADLASICGATLNQAEKEWLQKVKTQ